MTGANGGIKGHNLSCVLEDEIGNMLVNYVDVFCVPVQKGDTINSTKLVPT